MIRSGVNSKQLSSKDWVDKIHSLCGSSHWRLLVLKYAPYPDYELMKQSTQSAFDQLTTVDWLEAFADHPKIGDLASLKRKFASTAHYAASEQGLVSPTEEATLRELAQWNEKYFDKFGFIFIVFATGKTAQEMLDLLKARYPNSRDEEIKNASIEQRKITDLRLEKLWKSDLG